MPHGPAVAAIATDNMQPVPPPAGGGGQEDAVAPDDRRTGAGAGERDLPAHVFLRRPLHGQAPLGRNPQATRAAPARPVLAVRRRSGKPTRHAKETGPHHSPPTYEPR